MIFCNRTLNLKKISHIGLDMDHTLVQYHSREFEKLSYESMKEKLLKRGYSKEIAKFEFDYDRAIRGLVIDKATGNIFKVSRYGMVREAYHGLSKVDFRSQKKQFGSKFIDLGEPNFDCVDTNFSISHACLFSQIVDLKTKRPDLSFPDFPELSEELITVLDESHRDGSIKDEVTRNPEKYVKRSEEIVRGIEKFKKHGTKFFIATNSDYAYTDKILKFALDPFIEDGTWEDLFEHTFTLCMKPRFFYTNSPLLKINPEDGMMENWDQELVPGIYQGGSANLLAEQLKILGDNILYVGDHVYGDILMLKKNCGWRTALVIEELGEEIEQNQKALSITNEIKVLMNQKLELEYFLNELIGGRLEKSTDKAEQEKKVLEQISLLDEKLVPLIRSRAKIYNQYWGSVMRAGVEESQFAHQVEGYSDIYMPSIKDLLAESPRTYFRSYIRKMAHD
ncbi:MAG: HAD-IG family 5'-nucleotidase [Bdellovibrionales bacterium]